MGDHGGADTEPMHFHENSKQCVNPTRKPPPAGAGGRKRPGHPGGFAGRAGTVAFRCGGHGLSVTEILRKPALEPSGMLAVVMPLESGVPWLTPAVLQLPALRSGEACTT